MRHRDSTKLCARCGKRESLKLATAMETPRRTYVLALLPLLVSNNIPRFQSVVGSSRLGVSPRATWGLGQSKGDQNG
jgi:hypothetical protein